MTLDKLTTVLSKGRQHLGDLVWWTLAEARIDRTTLENVWPGAQLAPEREEFHVILLDVRGRLIKAVCVAQASLAQWPVSPGDVFREAIRASAHSVVFAHSHRSGDPSPSADDVSLTEQLRAASELIGVLARDHVIVASGGWYSFVEAGQWHR